MELETQLKEFVELMKKVFRKGGLRELKKYLETENDKWKVIPLHIAVIGNTGVGKSCFINAIRNVKRGDDVFAEEDVAETTKEPTPYRHPTYPNLVFWDLPGVGTEANPQEEYLDKGGFQNYDFFLILSSQRFTGNDHWLAKEIEKAEKRFLFVRSQIDLDVMKRDDLPENKVLEKVRGDCVKNLKADMFRDVEDKIFLP